MFDFISCVICVKKALLNSTFAEVMNKSQTYSQSPWNNHCSRSLEERWGCAESKMYIKKMKWSPKLISAEFSLREGVEANNRNLNLVTPEKEEVNSISSTKIPTNSGNQWNPVLDLPFNHSNHSSSQSHFNFLLSPTRRWSYDCRFKSVAHEVPSGLNPISN